eukprot:gene25868-11538_t
MRRSLNYVYALRCRLWSDHLSSVSLIERLGARQGSAVNGQGGFAAPQQLCAAHMAPCSVRTQFNEADAALDQAKIVAKEMKQTSGGIEIFDSGDDPLLSVASERLLDRLEDCKRLFPVAAVLGGASEHVLARLAGTRSGIEHVVLVDASQDMLDRVKRLRDQHARDTKSDADAKPWPTLETRQMEGDTVPLEAGSVNDADAQPWPTSETRHMEGDTVPVGWECKCLGLHWHNDLPGVLAQARIALKPDGLFLGSMFGGETLNELRMSCAAAQLERQGGVSPITSPLAQVRDAGNLLTRAGLTLPTVDIDDFCLNYPSVPHLIRHLRAAAMYQTMFGSDDGASIPATFQAKERGSATVSFQDLALGLEGKKGTTVGAEDDSPDAKQ